ALWGSGQGVIEAPNGPVASAFEQAREAGIPIRKPPWLCAHPQRFGGARVRVLWPCPHYDAGYAPNDNSLVLRITFKEHALLFVGGLERHGEARLLKRSRPLEADFLKVGHHGSATSSTRAFVEAVDPRFAAISVARFDRYGHPDEAPLAALDAIGARVLRTD